VLLSCTLIDRVATLVFPKFLHFRHHHPLIALKKCGVLPNVVKTWLLVVLSVILRLGILLSEMLVASLPDHLALPLSFLLKATSRFDRHHLLNLIVSASAAAVTEKLPQQLSPLRLLIRGLPALALELRTLHEDACAPARIEINDS
jgi:hypothetical protein